MNCNEAAPLVAAAGSTLDHKLTTKPLAAEPTLLASGVFESILVTRGKIIRLAAHLARLDRSCRELYGHGISDDLASAIMLLATNTFITGTVLDCDGGWKLRSA